MTNEKGKILLSDDEEEMRMLTSFTLQENFPQFEVESFEDGASLENRLNGYTHDVRLVITDNDMPRLTGSEIIDRYATRLRFKNIPFILCYGGEDQIGEKAVKNGAFAYIKKPFNPEDYVGIVRKALKL